MSILDPINPYFVMPSFRQLRDLAKADRDYFNEFKKLYKECK